MEMTSYLPQLRGLENTLVFSAPMIILLSSLAIYNRQLDATTQEQRWQRAEQELSPPSRKVQRSRLPPYPLSNNWIICNFGITYFLVILVISEAMARGWHGNRLESLQAMAGVLSLIHFFALLVCHLGLANDAWVAAINKLHASDNKAGQDATRSELDVAKAEAK